MSKDKIFLTKEDERRHMELMRDFAAAKRTCEIALKNHHNTINELEETRHELWDGIYEAYGLNYNHDYKVEWDRKERRAVLIDIGPEED